MKRGRASPESVEKEQVFGSSDTLQQKGGSPLLSPRDSYYK